MPITFAVQPTAWSSFDEHGCDWATDIDHAYRIAQAWGEDCTVWRVPTSGTAYKWMRVTEDAVDSIADLIFGV
jgi:hypothetical protein